MANKFHAKKVTYDGVTFDSTKEGNRYLNLKLLERGKKISNLELQPRFDIIVNGHNCGFYKADFRYYDMECGQTIIEDVKGLKSGAAYQIFRLKKKLVEAIYKVKINEVWL